MNEAQALVRMVPPSKPREGKPDGGVMQIHITRACDLACFGCTQGSNLAGKVTMITTENFEKACASLVDYFGIVGIFGGNPASHPQFETLCDILMKYIPKERRGLWCNNPMGHGAKMRETFNPRVSNLNVHLSRTAYEEFKRDWPESKPFGLDQDSRHATVYTAMEDVIADEGERWELISNCDVNQHWSAMIAEFRGELRGWFCEIAGAQSILHQWEPDYPDTGFSIEPGWWKRPMQDFAEQVRLHCHACGFPLRSYGEMAQADEAVGVEYVTRMHAGIYRPKRKGRTVQFVQMRTDLREQATARATDYLRNAKR